MDQEGTQPSRAPRLMVVCGAILGVGLVLRFALALLVPSVFFPDEIYQTLEPAHRLAFGTGVVTWEWREGIRSWVFPTFLAGVMRVTTWMGSGSTGYLRGTYLILSVISLLTVWFGYAWAKRASGNEAALIAAGACSIYFVLVYFAPKALYEVVSAHILLPGLYLGVYGDRIGEKKRMFLAGLFCGLATCLRIQFAPAVLFAAVYFCYPRWRQRFPFVLAGLAVPVLAFGLVDQITWSYPWQSFIAYFRVNLTSRAYSYGTEHWYWYGGVLLTLLGAIGLFLWHGSRRSPFLAIFSIIYVVSHSLIAHKEVRFLYPILPLALVLAAIGFVDVAKIVAGWFKLQPAPRTIVAAGLLFFVLDSAHQAKSLLKSWSQVNGAQIAFDHLSHDREICGVGVYSPRAHFLNNGGYSHLGANVPIIPITQSATIRESSADYNVLVAPSGADGVPSDFRQNGCWNGVCLLKRPGTCAAVLKEKELNTYLTSAGQ
jgi:GPI mannosyltransferase 3